MLTYKPRFADLLWSLFLTIECVYDNIDYFVGCKSVITFIFGVVSVDRTVSSFRVKYMLKNKVIGSKRWVLAFWDVLVQRGED
jgi:hypothetical protein